MNLQRHVGCPATPSAEPPTPQIPAAAALLIDLAKDATPANAEAARGAAGGVRHRRDYSGGNQCRSFSWIIRCRRTVRDYERLTEHHAAMVFCESGPQPCDSWTIGRAPTAGGELA